MYKKKRGKEKKKGESEKIRAINSEKQSSASPEPPAAAAVRRSGRRDTSDLLDASGLDRLPSPSPSSNLGEGEEGRSNSSKVDDVEENSRGRKPKRKDDVKPLDVCWLEK